MSTTPSKKEILFAIGFLRGAGLSREYAEILAERILEPGAQLTEPDAALLKLLRRGQAQIRDAVTPGWRATN